MQHLLTRSMASQRASSLSTEAHISTMLVMCSAVAMPLSMTWAFILWVLIPARQVFVRDSMHSSFHNLHGIKSCLTAIFFSWLCTAGSWCPTLFVGLFFCFACFSSLRLLLP